MDEMENNTFAPCVHIVHLFYLKCMLVSAAAHAPANRALNNTSPGTVSFFVDYLYTNFSPMKITSLTKINTKSENNFQAKVLGKLFVEPFLKLIIEINV